MGFTTEAQRTQSDQENEPDFVGAGLRPARSPITHSMRAGLRPAPTTYLALLHWKYVEDDFEVMIPV